MKILFTSDVSFNYFPKFPGTAAVNETMKETASVFASADFSVVNLENILGNKNDYTPIVKSGPNLISDDDFVQYLDVLKPSAVGLANNHTGDYGNEAMIHTFEILENRNYKVFGAGENIEKAYMPAIFEKDGTQVAVIAVCENEFGIAEEERSGAAGYSLGLVTKSIADARSKGMLPVIYFHGGNEFNPFPSPGKTELYRHFIDLGAKAVIAMHTHCPQGYETYNGCPIIYSMGNFFFPKPSESIMHPSWNYGYMTMLNITNEAISFEILPYRFSMDSHIMLEGEEKERFMEYIKVLNSPIGDKKRLQKLFDSWCVIVGIGSYMNSVSGFTAEMINSGAAANVHIKNIFHCEAHNELIKNSFKIMVEERIDEASVEIDYIKKLQNMEIS